MAGIDITVSIPVGPYEHNRKWLGECMNSIYPQLRENDTIVLVYEPPNDSDAILASRVLTKIIEPCRLGIPAMVNLSVAHAQNNHVLLMNSDDKLLPGAIDAVRAAWDRHRDFHGWYYLNSAFSDGRYIQRAASGVAMVYKPYFLELGGYPPESAVGGPDWMFLSLMSHQNLIKLYPVSDDTVYHWHRVHPDQESAKRRGDWDEAMSATHEALVKTWRKP